MGWTERTSLWVTALHELLCIGGGLGCYQDASYLARLMRLIWRESACRAVSLIQGHNRHDRHHNSVRGICLPAPTDHLRARIDVLCHPDTLARGTTRPNDVDPHRCSRSSTTPLQGATVPPQSRCQHVTAHDHQSGGLRQPVPWTTWWVLVAINPHSRAV